MDIQYLCNGPRHDVAEDEFLKILAEFKSALAPEDVAALDGSAYERPLTFGPVTRGGHTLLFIRTDSAVAVREYCGTDLAEAIAEVPEDGEVHSVKCPKCETSATVKKAGIPDMTETDRILGGTAA